MHWIEIILWKKKEHNNYKELSIDNHMVYTNQKAIDRAFKHKEYKLIKQAKAQHPDVKLAHPDFCRDAATGHYTLIKTHIKQLKEKHLKHLQQQKEKLGERL